MAIDTELPINEESVTRWIQERTEADAPLRFELIAGGRSNMTYTVTDAAGRKFVLRRPPMGPLLPSAHDMGREHRLMHSLRDSPVPVPRMVGLCLGEIEKKGMNRFRCCLRSARVEICIWDSCIMLQATLVKLVLNSVSMACRRAEPLPHCGKRPLRVWRCL